jgi:tetratricopeptide (TPR) repeat protein
MEPDLAANVPAANNPGERLRLLLQRAQLTPERLATRLNQHAKQLGLVARMNIKSPYKWFRGTVPRAPWPTLICTILSERIGVAITVSDIGWQKVDVGLNYVPATNGLTVSWDGAGTIAVIIDVVERDAMDRRVFIGLAGTALTQPALEWLIARPASDVSGAVGRRVLDTHVDEIVDITARLRRLDDQFGGGALREVVRSQTRFVLDLLRNRQYTSSVGRRLHGAVGELLRLAGWASHDSGDHPTAQRFWLASLHAAHSAGDRAAGANVLGFMAQQAIDRDQPGEAIHLAEAARKSYRGPSHRVTAILGFRAARAYARANDAKQCRRALDIGQDAFQSADTTQGPDWAYWLDAAEVNVQAARSHMSLKDWSRARTHLLAAIRLDNDLSRHTDGAVAHTGARETANRLSLLASAYAGQGEPEEACTTAGRAVDLLIDEVDSNRCISQVRRAVDQLTPYRRTPAVRELRDRVRQSFGTDA